MKQITHYWKDLQQKDQTNQIIIEPMRKKQYHNNM